MDAALVVLDGWGLAPPDQSGRDAVSDARTPTMDALANRGATTQLRTDGRTVGLPAGQMGNSEVGHLTIGAGKPVEQAYTRIEDALQTGSLDSFEAIDTAFEHLETTGGRLHLVGLVSDGGVHADHRHLHALIRAAAEREIPATSHAVTDGRDTPPTGGDRFVAELEAVAAETGTGAVATVAGRYYAMDRDENWERTRRAYDAMAAREAPYTAPTAVSAVKDAYDRGETDEFIIPTIVTDRPSVSDGDAVLLCNFRADRARQLTRLFAGIDPVWPDPPAHPDVHVLTMTEYDREFDLPVVIEPNPPTATLGSVLADAGRSQLRVAESEKYAHVTYFLNGGREIEFPGETRHIVESPAVSTYDAQPEMHAHAVTDTVLSSVESADPDIAVVNYANPDMVGHTGDYDAAVAAVEAVDTELGRLVPVLRAAGAHVLVTADHGNAEDMGTPTNPHTAHTDNPVPVVSVSPDGSRADRPLRNTGTLADLAPTLLRLLEIPIPEEMTGQPLFTPAQ